MQGVKNLENILVVEDDVVLCEHIRAGLVEEGYNVVAVNKARQAIEESKKQTFSIVLTDLVLPDISGIELMRALLRTNPDIAFILFTGNATISSVIEALKIGAYDYIIKPFDFEHLKLVLRRCIEKQFLLISNKELVNYLLRDKFKFEIILDAYNKMSAIAELKELADFVTRKAVEIAEAEKASIMLVDNKANELVLEGAKGLAEEKTARHMKIGELIAGWVAQQGEVLLVKDIDTDPRLQMLTKKPRPGYRTKSFVSLPLKTNSHVIGVMNVTDKLAGTGIFDENDLKYLSLLAYQTVAQIQGIRLLEKLSSLAVTDPLTGLFNHRYFQELVNSEIIRCQRYKHALSLIMFDVDFFKSFNDNYGHLEGDRVLKLVAQILLQNVRKVDIVCRYGGEEFMIILPDTDVKGASFVSEKIRSSAEKIELTNGAGRELKRSITLSGGVAGYKQGWSKDDFIHKVDEALYKAKSGGRNRVCIVKE